MTDHEINLTLARFMGWREIASTGRPAGDFHQEIGEAMLAEGVAFFLLEDGSICPGRARKEGGQVDAGHQPRAGR